MARKKNPDGKTDKKGGGFSIPLKDIVNLGKVGCDTVETTVEYWREKEKTRQVELNIGVRIRESDNKLAEARMKSARERERNYTAFVEAISKASNECLELRNEGLHALIKTYTDIYMVDDNPEIRSHCLACLTRLEQYILQIDNENIKRTASAWLEGERRCLS